MPSTEPPNIPVEQAPAPVPRRASLGTIGICHLAESPSDIDNAANMLSVPAGVENYFADRHWKLSGTVTERVLRLPRHGKLLTDNAGLYTYRPDEGYRGPDRITILAGVGTKSLRIEYFVHVMQFVPADDIEPDVYSRGYCPVKARVWRIIPSSGKATSHRPQ